MIFLYGSQVMRGVIEEKTSRIVEVIVSSVKPFQLMLGKIIGVAFVGITQFILWIVFTVNISLWLQTYCLKIKLLIH
jgi:ABC-2 type transport system permease protein